jgi:hypothetical protein
MALIVLVHISGCAGEAGLPKESTPVVTPDSEAAKKAIAEREQMIQQRQRQEAKARRRSGNLPSEG